jgi:hypothetical protein
MKYISEVFEYFAFKISAKLFLSFNNIIEMKE